MEVSKRTNWLARWLQVTLFWRSVSGADFWVVVDELCGAAIVSDVVVDVARVELIGKVVEVLAVEAEGDIAEGDKVESKSIPRGVFLNCSSWREGGPSDGDTGEKCLDRLGFGGFCGRGKVLARPPAWLSMPIRRFLPPLAARCISFGCMRPGSLGIFIVLDIPCNKMGGGGFDTSMAYIVP